jgi:two-component system response regulator NreC
MSSTKILLLDDHPIILDGLAAFLDAQPELTVVARCETTEQAAAVLRATLPDVAIVDVKVQGGFSFEFVNHAKKVLPELKIVFITGHDDDLFIEKAFQAGALGYVLKSEPLTEVGAAVFAAVKGERYLSAAVKKRVSVAEGEGSGNQVQTRLSMLTRREREVLHYVSQGRSAKEISEILKISTWTVTNHKANIMAKLDIHNQVGLTRFAVSTGLADLRV